MTHMIMPHRSLGFSIVELMIALALGVVITAGIVQLFVANDRTYTLLNGQARLQESARYAFDFIKENARSTGFLGCGPELENLVKGLRGTWPMLYEFDITTSIEGYDGKGDGTWAPSLAELPRTEAGITTNAYVAGYRRQYRRGPTGHRCARLPPCSCTGGTARAEKLDELRQSFRMGIKIGEGTRIGENVMLGLGVSIGRFCEISDNCEICIFSTLHDKVHLGKSAFVGKDSEIESESIIMPKAVIAPRNIVKKKSLITEGSVFNRSKKYQ